MASPHVLGSARRWLYWVAWPPWPDGRAAHKTRELLPGSKKYRKQMFKQMQLSNGNDAVHFLISLNIEDGIGAAVGQPMTLLLHCNFSEQVNSVL